MSALFASHTKTGIWSKKGKMPKKQMTEFKSSKFQKRLCPILFILSILTDYWANSVDSDEETHQDLLIQTYNNADYFRF